ncbi:MAG TPA: clostripain-related cysteine peptidase [Patescibacteria group bacterium]|nr:clostripain-related cysteine peptidase [Patescibacteria group bacterium]
MLITNKKITFAVTGAFLFLIIILNGCTFSPDVKGSGKAQYTVMIYMNGSDLESDEEDGGAATDNLRELLDIGSDGNVNVVVETGGTKEWYAEEISSENQRWLLSGNELELVKDDLGKKNMASPSTLEDFICWSVANYPAQKYVLIFWDHGGGAVYGFGNDENYPQEPSLTVDKIRLALDQAYQKTNTRFELIGFDACLMANLETADAIGAYADYLVASEEVEPAHGWDYSHMLESLKKNPGMSGATLGKAIADGYKAKAEEWETFSEITLSVIRLDKVPAVIKAVNDFAKQTSVDLQNPTRIMNMAKSRARAEDYGDQGDGVASDMVDLYDLVKASAPSDISRQMMQSIKEAVVYNVTGDMKPHAQGISIYFPCRDKESFAGNLKKYQHIGFSPDYIQFVTQYAASLANTRVIELEAKVPQQVRNKMDEYITFQLKIDPAEIPYVDAVYSVLAQPLAGSGNRVMILGRDRDVDVAENGFLQSEFGGGWVTLGGYFVSMYLTEITDDYDAYSIPVKLNGKNMYILVLYTDEKPEGKIIGAWRGIDRNSGMADRRIRKIKPGDKIIPRYPVLNLDTREETEMEGAEFTVDKKLRLGVSDLPSGDYLYGFAINDIFQHEQYSTFSKISVGQK